jgi:hypothetical protein
MFRSAWFFDWEPKSKELAKAWTDGGTVTMKRLKPTSPDGKIRYDGTKMNLISDIAEKTGLGLGVHVTATPDATGFAVADGQKDIFAEFDREAEKVRSVVKRPARD